MARRRRDRTRTLLEIYLTSDNYSELQTRMGFKSLRTTYTAVHRLRKALLLHGQELPPLGQRRAPRVDYAALAEYVRQWKKEQDRQRLRLPGSKVIELPRVTPPVTARPDPLANATPEMREKIRSLEQLLTDAEQAAGSPPKRSK